MPTRVLYDRENLAFVVIEDPAPDNPDRIKVTYLFNEEILVDTYDRATGQGVGDTPSGFDFQSSVLDNSKELSDYLRTEFDTKHGSKYPDIPTDADLELANKKAQLLDRLDSVDNDLKNLGQDIDFSRQRQQIEDAEDLLSLQSVESQIETEEQHLTALKILPPEPVTPLESQPTVQQTAQEFRFQLARREAQAVDRFADGYIDIYTNLQDNANNLINEVNRQVDRTAELEAGLQRLIVDNAPEDQIAAQRKAIEDSQISKGKLVRLSQYQDLHQQAVEMLSEFGVDVYLPELNSIRDDTVATGVEHARQYITQSLPGELGQLMQGSFSTLSKEAILQTIPIVTPDSPLTQSISQRFGQAAADTFGGELLKGITIGLGPEKIARNIRRNMQKGLGESLDWTIRNVRDAQLNIYNRAAHETYKANQDIIPGWTWDASIDQATCMSCYMMHGTEHAFDETLVDHSGGRCTPLPLPVSFASIGLVGFDHLDPTPIQRGEDRFLELDEEEQKRIMGPRTHKAWKEGQISLQQFSSTKEDPVYGTRTGLTSLRSMLEGGGGREITSPVDKTPFFEKKRSADDLREELEKFRDWKNRSLGDPETVDLTITNLERQLEETLRTPLHVSEEKRAAVESLIKDLPPSSRVVAEQTLLNEVPESHIVGMNGRLVTNTRESKNEYVLDNYETEPDAFLDKGDNTRAAGLWIQNDNEGTEADIAVHPSAYRTNSDTLIHELGHDVTLRQRAWIQNDDKMLEAYDLMDGHPDPESLGLRYNSSRNFHEFLADCYLTYIRGSESQKRNLAQHVGVDSLDEYFGE